MLSHPSSIAPTLRKPATRALKGGVTSGVHMALPQGRYHRIAEGG